MNVFYFQGLVALTTSETAKLVDLKKKATTKNQTQNPPRDNINGQNFITKDRLLYSSLLFSWGRN